MSSIDFGKAEVCEWIKNRFHKGASCLDVGSCDGKWSDLLGDYLDMDGIEIFPKNVTDNQLWKKYRHITIGDVRDFHFGVYACIIFGDVIEHMEIDEAQYLLKYAARRCDDMVVGVPFRWRQDAIYGNPFEKHIQDDLTHEVFMGRYPGFEPLILFSNYGYYIKK